MGHLSVKAIIRKKMHHFTDKVSHLCCSKIQDGSMFWYSSARVLLKYSPYVCMLRLSNMDTNSTIEGLLERTEYIDIFLFSAHHSIVFCFRCSGYWWKGSVRF